MKMMKNRKRRALHLLGFLAALMLFCLPVSAGVQEGVGEYEIYPTPQSIEYGTDMMTLTDTVNVTVGSQIDSYTVDRLAVTLDVLGLKQADKAVSGNTNLIIGVYGSGDEADKYGAAWSVEASLFDEYDSYAVWIQDGDIVILGKNTDAAYYGLTTLKRIFEQLDGKQVKELVIKDYAEVEFRGFIEGYYGNPWSNEDRIDLMQFGSEIKMNQYIFAPKDDPYHNSKWRELYPEEDLKKIAALAEAGNKSKCFYVYALHTFMSNPIQFTSDEVYASELQVVKNKLYQVISQAGVRQVAILEDDATGASAANIIRYMNDLNAWLHELKETEFPDLKTDILYCPTCYMYTTHSKLTEINAGVSDEIHIVMTGGKIWGEVSSEFADNFYAGLATNGNEGRYPYMWVNWPCNDNTKTSTIMGGHNTILHTGVDGHKYEGIVLNPIQESEPSKVGIFTAADYCWKVWDTEEEGDQAWYDCFKYIDHMTAIETDESAAFREAAKHMITQGPSQTTAGKQQQFDESVEIKDVLTAFQSKLNSGNITAADIDTVLPEFEKIADAADLYLENGNNKRTISQLTPFMSCLRDLAKASANSLKAIKANLEGDGNSAWNYFAEAQAAYEASGTYGFNYYGIGTIYAEAGRKYITPFTEDVMDYVSDLVQVIMNPEASTNEQKYNGTFSVTDGWSKYQGDVANMTDGDDSTYIWYNPSTTTQDTSLAGDYIQLDLGDIHEVGRVRAVIGAGDGDKWTKYHVAYSTDGSSWTSLSSYTGASSGKDIYEVNLEGASARYIRIVNDTTVGKWVKFSELSAYTYTGDANRAYTNTALDLEMELGEEVSRLLPVESITLQPGEYIGLKLFRIREIASITVAGEGTNALTLEKSVNTSEWETTKTGAARYIRLINKTDAAVTFVLDSFIVTSNELSEIDLLETNFGGASNSEDPRTLGTTKYWFDGDLSTKAKYCSTPSAGSYVTYDLGQEITLRSLKVYVLDTAIDYPRDAVIQSSMDNATWVDHIVIGDGVSNSGAEASTNPIENDCGYLHDTIDPAYAYVENANIENVTARYIRVYCTAAYNSRWLELNEIVINGGEYIPTINDPTFETDADLERGFEPQMLNDGNLTTAFKPAEGTGSYVIYNLSDDAAVTRLNILQSGSTISNAAVSVRTGADTWVKVGTLNKSYNAFYTGDLENVYAVKIEWADVAPTLYEIITLQEAHDMDAKLENDKASAEAELAPYAAETAAAEAELNEVNAKVAAAEKAVAAATTTVDKLRAEVELNNLYAEQAEKAAAVAEKKAAESEKAGLVAECEAALLKYQAATAATDAEKAQLAADAAAKEAEAQKCYDDIAAYEKEAAEKKASVATYTAAAAAKQKALNEELAKPVTPDVPVTPTVTSVTVKNVNYKVLNESKKTAVAYGVANKSVKSVTIAKTVTINGVSYKVVEIAAKAFKGCTKLQKVTVGANVQKIGKEAFANCKKLKTVNLKKAANITSVGKKAFSKINAKAKFSVPAKKRAKYQKMLIKKGKAPKTVKVK